MASVFTAICLSKGVQSSCQKQDGVEPVSSAGIEGAWGRKKAQKKNEG